MVTKDTLRRVAELSADAARKGGSLALKVARRAAEPLVERRRSGETYSPAPPAAQPSPPQPPLADVVRPDPPAPAPASEPAPAPAPAAGVADAEPEHVDREAVVVAVSADPGADEGPGPQIHIDEPWSGYGELNVKQVNAELVDASPEMLAIVRLYESVNRNRSTVLDAIDRRLAAVSD